VVLSSEAKKMWIQQMTDLIGSRTHRIDCAMLEAPPLLIILAPRVIPEDIASPQMPEHKTEFHLDQHILTDV